MLSKKEPRAMGRLILILGGARSGKSRFAQQLAQACSDEEHRPVVYVATAEAGDEHMRRRIEKHRRDRPLGWKTVEAPQNVAAAVEAAGDSAAAIIVDCLTLFISNLLLAGGEDFNEDETQVAAKEETILDEVKALIRAARKGNAQVIIASNEVGMGIVPLTRLGRIFREIAGRANQALAQAADEVYVMWAGLPQRIK
jgi:adenosylcobinamide kinase/adenosylcobinamide-phosphate guanylyltransferase